MKSCKRSEVWTHFNITPDQPKVAVCRHCKRGISFSGGSTGNLSRHLRKKHPVTASLPYGAQRKATKTKERTLNSGQESLLLEFEEGMEDIEEEEDEGKKDEESRDFLSSFSKRSNDRARNSQGTAKAHRVVSASSSSLQRALLKIDEMASSDQDEFSLFGTYIANQLKKLPMENALKCQQEIQAIITRERLNALRSNTETNYYYIAESSPNTIHHATTSTTPIIETVQLPVNHRNIVIGTGDSEAQAEQSVCVQTEE